MVSHKLLQCSLGHVVRIVVYDTISVAWSERAGQPAAGGVAPVWRYLFDPHRVHDNLSVPFWVYMRFPMPEHQYYTNRYVYRQCQGAVQNQHTDVEIDTCQFQTGCQLSSTIWGMSLELCFITQFQWHEVNVLDNWQLAVLSQYGGREFDPRRVHDNLSVPLWVYTCFHVPEHQIKPTNIFSMYMTLLVMLNTLLH